MDIDDTPFILLSHGRRNHHQESGQYNQIQIIFIYFGKKCLVERVPGGKLFWRNADSPDPMLSGSLQSIGSRIIADDHRYLCIGNITMIHGVQNCLKIGSASGYQYAHS